MTADAVKLTPLAAMVLALLAEGDMHPYEMIRLLRHRQDDRIVRVTNGTFYHTVARLERDGLIAEVGVDREGNRPERTTYTLRPAARSALENCVRAGLSTSDRTAEFRVALAESHNLPRADVIGLLTARLAALQTEHDSLHGKLTAARARGVLDQFLIEADRHVTLLRAEITWTAGVLERLSDPDFAWFGDASSSASTGDAASMASASS